jgi:hypothetical protein
MINEETIDAHTAGLHPRHASVEQIHNRMHKTHLTADERSRGNHSSGSRKEQVDVVELHCRRRWWLRRLVVVSCLQTELCESTMCTGAGRWKSSR